MNDERAALSPIRRFLNTLQARPMSLLPYVLIIAAIARIIFIPNKGFEADISFWKSWGLAVLDNDVVWSIKNTNNNYPTAFAYVLGGMARVYSLFADPHNFDEFWNNNNLLFLTVAKLPAVIADFLIFGIFVLIGKWANRFEGLGLPKLPFSFWFTMGAFYLLSPLTIMDSAWWGQVDSLGVVIFLVAVLLAVWKKPYLAGFIYMASMMTKLQNMIYGPVFFILLWQLTGFPGLMRGIFGSVTAFVGLNIEFFLARQMGLVFESLTVNYDYFPFMSLNAYNLWWIVAKAQGMSMLDKFSMIGMTNAKIMGLYMFSSLYLLAVLLMVRETIVSMLTNGKIRAQEDAQTVLYRFFTALIIVACAFFLFQTQSHDRYAFPLTAFIPLWAGFFFHASLTREKREHILTTRLFKRFFWVFTVFTIVYFFNLHNALVDNYPQNGLPILRDWNIPWLTLTMSYIQLALFGVFLIAMTRHVSWTFLLIPVFSFSVLLGIQNLPLITKTPVRLTSYTPIVSQQGYLSRQTDMSVNSALGIKSWNPLSVQYAFYRRGIGTHANSYHLYHINGKYRKFTVDAGIDTDGGVNGSATFEIYGDDKPLYISKPIGRFQMPIHIEVDVTGVEKLGLVTNDAGDGINDDHTDWLNPLLWP